MYLLSKHYNARTVRLLSPFLDNLYLMHTTFAGAEPVAASSLNFFFEELQYS